MKNINQEQLKRMKEGKGFIAALDQSGGSTPRALRAYGVAEDAYKNEDEMFDLVHEMRTRIIKSPGFSSDKILAAILFEQTMNREIDGKKTGDFLWEEKGIVPFIKVDKGLAEIKDGVQLMKDMPQLDELLKHSKELGMFGTKMRSVIKENNEAGIEAIIAQQFEIGERIWNAGLVPILEPEVDIHSEDKAEIEKVMLEKINEHLKQIPEDMLLMFKITIPTEKDLYADLMRHPQVVRVVALSGGYTREDANKKLSENEGLIASFSRALAEGLSVEQSDDEFDETLAKSVDEIYQASIR